MNKQLAPVALFVYNRLNHTKKTVESLKKNILSNETELYIFSDAAKNDNEIKNVDNVRAYIETITGFKKITIVKATQNKGLARSIIDGVSNIIKQYGKIIVLEDDLQTSNVFLKYMNDALDFYETEEKIWSISGYHYPFEISERYPNKIYYAYRASSWGWATWKDRWDTIDWSVSDFPKYRFNPFKIAHFCKGGTDLDKLLRQQMKSEINSWAIRWCYSQSMQRRYSVYPCKSLVLNLGTDGSGTHFDENISRFNTTITDNYNYSFTRDIKLDKTIMHQYRKIVNRSPLRKIKRLLKRLNK